MGIHQEWVEGKRMTKENYEEALKFAMALTFIASGTSLHLGWDKEENITVMGNKDGENQELIPVLLDMYNILGGENEDKAQSVMFSSFIEIIVSLMTAHGPQFSNNLLEIVQFVVDEQKESMKHVLRS